MSETTEQAYRRGVHDGATDARDAARNYCILSAQTAEEAPDNPYAVGLAKAYRDLSARLAEPHHFGAERESSR